MIGLGRARVAFLLFILAFFALPLRAQNALVLIPYEATGPHLDSANYFHAEWIRWPHDQKGLNNRILSLATGIDLAAEQADSSFNPVGDEEWRSQNVRRLERRGFFDARYAYLGKVPIQALRQEDGRLSPSVLLLALDDPGGAVRTRSIVDDLPKTGTVVVEAANWDQAIGLAKRATGRTLILEYPPNGEDGWSKFWRRGSGWPVGVPTEKGLEVPGLVHGRQALALLLRPQTFAWGTNDVGRWGGPNRWLEHGRDVTPSILGFWFGLTVFVVAWALAQVMNEDRGPFVSQLLVFTALAPAALLATGAASRLGGLESWPVVLIFAWAFLYGFAWSISLVQRRYVPEAHPLWAVCAVGLLCAVLFDPLWSDLSGRWGALEFDVPGQALGVFLAYLVGFAAFARGRWTGRAVVAALLLWGVTAHPWWVDGHSALLVAPAVVLIAAEGLFRPPLLVVLALLPTGLWRIVQDGVTWSTNGLHAFADQARSLNVFQTFVLFFSPAWLATIAVFAAGLLVGNRFLAYRLHRLLRHDPRLRAFLWTAAGVLALSVTEPLALPAVPVLVFGSLIVLGYDGLRANG